MNLIRLKAVARKEMIQVLRDSRSLFIVLVMPVTLMLFFGYGVNLDLKGMPICVFDRSQSQQSRELIQRFAASRYFHIEQYVGDYAAVTRSLDEGRAKIGLVIPWDFSTSLAAGRPVQIQALLDASDDNSARISMGYAQAVVQAYDAQLRSEWLNRAGIAGQIAPLRVEPRTWYNENLESSAFIIPGVLALVMSVIGAFLTSLTIAREWERGTMEQLISTPVTAMEILLGKLAPYFFMGMIDVAVCVAVAIGWFHVPFRGSILQLFFSSALFLVVVMTLGFLISVVAKNQFAASQVALLVTFLPAFLLSGFLFAIEQMPRVLQVITHIVPARYYIEILKKVFLKGSSSAQLLDDLIPLGLFALVLALVSSHAFRKRLE